MTSLCLYTASFPYGMGEQFIETEIKYLAQTFQRVVIIPNLVIGAQRPLPENVEILQPSYDGYSTFKGLKKSGKWLLYCLQDVLKHPQKKIMLSSILRASFQAYRLSLFLQQNQLIDNTLHYSYWFDLQSTLLSILSAKGIIKGYISRAHGFDLYAERRNDGFIPFRQFQLKHLTRLYLISQNGLNYMKSHYPKYSDKFELSYLGVINNSSFHYAEKFGEFTIVSCSRIVDIKRVDLIVESLALITHIPIKWIHFGDGVLSGQIKDLAEKILPGNIGVDFRGNVDNWMIYDFYKNNQVDCFINLSSSEGLPVSIMEAISYGIPILATDVGGTSEIVTSLTGTLLNMYCTKEEVALAIENVLMNKSREQNFRNNAYKFWQQYFNAEKKYSEFAAKIHEIVN